VHAKGVTRKMSAAIGFACAPFWQNLALPRQPNPNEKERFYDDGWTNDPSTTPHRLTIPPTQRRGHAWLESAA